MKTYSFERVYGNEAGEQVEIHGKRHGLRLGAKLLCLVLAFLFWLIVTNVDLSQNAPENDTDGASNTECVA